MEFDWKFSYTNIRIFLVFPTKIVYAVWILKSIMYGSLGAFVIYEITMNHIYISWHELVWKSSFHCLDISNTSFLCRLFDWAVQFLGAKSTLEGAGKRNAPYNGIIILYTTITSVWRYGELKIKGICFVFTSGGFC